MSAPSAQQSTLPLFRTPGVWKGIGIGLALGAFLTFASLYFLSFADHVGEGESGLNRMGAIGVGDGGELVISASSCDASRTLAGIAKASVPVLFRVKLLRVVDGDTIRVLWHGEDTAVRLLGINAPERNQAGGREATEFLRSLLADAESIDLAFEGTRPRRDSLGRLLAYVLRNKMNLNTEMLRSGHAVPYPIVRYAGLCRRNLHK